MNKKVRLEIIGHGTYEIASNVKLLPLLRAMRIDNGCICAIINDDLVDLNYIITKDSKIKLIKKTDRIGRKIYQSGLKMILTYSIKELFGYNTSVKIEHSIDKGIYCELEINEEVTNKTINTIKNKMAEIVTKKININRVTASTESAEEYFSSIKEFEKVELYKNYISATATLYSIGDYYNYFYTKMPTNTELINEFDLKYIGGNSFILMFPVEENEPIPEYNGSEKLLNIFKEYETWLKILDLNFVSKVNKLVSESRIEEFIQLNEIKQNNDMIDIVNKIHKDKKIKIVLIAGPSSSGKTTTANKIGLYLKTKGLNPYTISTDDYYKDRNQTPLDEFGKPDLECLEALDTNLFNDHLQALLNKEEIEIPTYSFKIGKKEYNGKKYKLKENDILIIEGLHTLNEKLTNKIPRENKYKIYVSPFTPLGIDRHNHISTVDTRLLRRLVRDNLFRGVPPRETLDMWKSVRRGEEKYVFPFVNEADDIFNTALIYEIGVMRTYAEPLLYSVGKQDEYYYEAKRLLNFLTSFYPIPGEHVPKESILREFIGGSYFE